MSKIFLTDIDTVVLDWQTAFTRWVKDNTDHNPTKYLSHTYWIDDWLNITYDEGEELVHAFHTSEDFSNINAYMDAKHILPKLKDDGYEFVAITAVPDHKEIREMREENLEKIFPGFFKDLILVDYTGSKLAELCKFDSTHWVDDRFDHVKSGVRAGHNSFHLLRHPCSYNDDTSLDDHALFNRALNWHDVYDKVNVK